MGIKEITIYKDRYCAELTNGKYILSAGMMELLLCEKVEGGMKVIKAGIVGGIMMKNEDDFRWCVEHLDEASLANDKENDAEDEGNEDNARKANDIREKISALYEDLKNEVIAFVYKHQGSKGYIDTQVSKGLDTIYAILYDWDLDETTEQYVYGVRACYGRLEVALQPITKTYEETWSDDEFASTQWKEVAENSDETYFRVTLDNIAENIKEYV
jgi:hypothetical protein